MLELACADYTFPLLGRQQALALLRLLEFEWVDIGLFARNPNFSPSALSASPRGFTLGVRNDLDAAGLRPSDVFLQLGEDPTQLSANDPDKQVRQSARDGFCRALEFCSAIQCAHMSGLPGVLHQDRTRDLARAAQEARWRTETAAKAGVLYSIEPHLESICESTQATCAFLSQAEGLSLTLDYGHFLFRGETNAAIHELLPYASHVHLRGAAPGRLQARAAKSTVDLKPIVSCLSSGHRVKAALEYVWSSWHDCDSTDNLCETILLRRQVLALHASLIAAGNV